jgi:hypothetical protein
MEVLVINWKSYMLMYVKFCLGIVLNHVEGSKYVNICGPRKLSITCTCSVATIFLKQLDIAN